VVVRIGPQGEQQAADVLARSDATDLALLRVNPDQPLRALPLADSQGVDVGDPVYAIGSPFGLDQTLTDGIVSATNRTIQGLDGSPIEGAIQTDAALNPGNSGGPLLDSSGRVIGINSQIASQGGGSNGIGFAIPAATLKRLVEELRGASAQTAAYSG
jgi:putative serine protease PepD